MMPVLFDKLSQLRQSPSQIALPSEPPVNVAGELALSMLAKAFSESLKAGGQA